MGSLFIQTRTKDKVGMVSRGLRPYFFQSGMYNSTVGNYNMTQAVHFQVKTSFPEEKKVRKLHLVRWLWFSMSPYSC